MSPDLSHGETIAKIDGYDTITHCRKRSGKYKSFGGILVFIKACIKNGIKVGRKLDDTLEITLLKNYFGLCKDTKFLFTYSSPLNSPYIVSSAENIQENYIDDEGNSIIMGDLILMEGQKRTMILLGVKMTNTLLLM